LTLLGTFSCPEVERDLNVLIVANVARAVRHCGSSHASGGARAATCVPTAILPQRAFHPQ